MVQIALQHFSCLAPALNALNEILKIITITFLRHLIFSFAYPWNNNIINSFAIRNPMIPQPGNVMTQVITMSLTTLKLMADRRFTAPTPMMAVVFVCVVLTGIPKMENPRRQAAPAISAEKPGISPAVPYPCPRI